MIYELFKIIFIHKHQHYVGEEDFDEETDFLRVAPVNLKKLREQMQRQAIKSMNRKKSMKKSMSTNSLHSDDSGASRASRMSSASRMSRKDKNAATVKKSQQR